MAWKKANREIKHIKNIPNGIEREKMNYLKQILAFEKLSEGLNITSNARSMYYALLKKNNELAWINEFTIPNTVLQAISKIKHRDTFNNARQSLINSNLIVYEKGKKGQAGTYEIKKIYEEDEVQVPVQDQVQVPGTLNKQNKTKQNETKQINRHQHSIIKSAGRSNVIQVAKYVFLTKEEIKKIKSKYGNEISKRAVEKLNIYKASSPDALNGEKAYTDDYIPLVRWALNEAKKENLDEQIKQNKLKKSEKELSIVEKKEKYYQNKKSTDGKNKNPDNFSGNYEESFKKYGLDFI